MQLPVLVGQIKNRPNPGDLIRIPRRLQPLYLPKTIKLLLHGSQAQRAKGQARQLFLRLVRRVRLLTNPHRLHHRKRKEIRQTHGAIPQLLRPLMQFVQAQPSPRASLLEHQQQPKLFKPVELTQGHQIQYRLHTAIGR